MQDAWMIRKAEEIQGYADRNEMKNFFKAIKAIYGPCIKGSAPLLSSDGTTLLTEKSQILKRWAEHFRNVLNCSSAISDAAIDRLPQVDTNNDLEMPPSLPKTIRAVQQISSGKAPGYDAIPPEVRCLNRIKKTRAGSGRSGCGSAKVSVLLHLSPARRTSFSVLDLTPLLTWSLRRDGQQEI
ncbi:unnamed protein product [Schistocephalus solidus]|uniref:Reverse transcriptase domain-containing protein n=1 Tax=Schistocephalus solidus TaxID=70667 RepID=A0A183SL89_SCHSO|nr:unnamed protein product [Schistocephalus solidus]